jgi:uncharacterized protein (TIGR02246 family)
MIRLCLFLSILGLFLVLACAPAKPVIDLAAEKETIRKLTPDLLDAELRRDMEASLSYFAPDAVIQLEGARIPGPPTVTGTAAIRAMYQEIFEMPYTDIVWEPQTIVIAASGDLAYEIGTMKIVFEGPDATTVAPGKATIIWRKSDNQWKASIMHVSTGEPYTY